jgi:hypothetical protein
VLQDASPDYVEALLHARGRDAPLDGGHDVMLDFRGRDLDRIRAKALTQLSDLSQHGDDPLTPAEVDGLMRGHPGAALPGVVGGGSFYLRGIAQSRNRGELLDALTWGSLGNSSALLSQLYELEAAQGPSGRLSLLG